MGLRSPEQLEQVADGEAGRRKDRFLHDLRDLRAAFVGLLVEILLVQDADDMVQVLVIHGYPGKPGVAEQVRRFLDGRRVLDRGHVHPGSHDIRCVLVVELDRRANQFSLILLDVALGLRLIDDGHQFLFNLVFLPFGFHQFAEQLPPQGEQEIQRLQDDHQHTDRRAHRHGELFRLLLGKGLGPDFTDKKDHHCHHDGCDRCGEIFFPGQDPCCKQKGGDCRRHDIHQVVADQYGSNQGVIFFQQGERDLRPFLPGAFHRLQLYPVACGESRFRRGKEGGKRDTQNQGKP